MEYFASLIIVPHLLPMFGGLLANQPLHVISGVDTKIRVLIPPSLTGSALPLGFQVAKIIKKMFLPSKTAENFFCLRHFMKYETETLLILHFKTMTLILLQHSRNYTILENFDNLHAFPYGYRESHSHILQDWLSPLGRITHTMSCI